MKVHILNCLCWRDKPPAMEQPDGGEDIGCLMLRERLIKENIIQLNQEEPGFFGRAAARLQKQNKAMLDDIHSAWLALAESDINEANRLLVKWVEVYRGYK